MEVYFGGTYARMLCELLYKVNARATIDLVQ